MKPPEAATCATLRDAERHQAPAQGWTCMGKAGQITQASGRMVDGHHATLRLAVADNVVDVAHRCPVPCAEVEHVRSGCWQEAFGRSVGPQETGGDLGTTRVPTAPFAVFGLAKRLAIHGGTGVRRPRPWRCSFDAHGLGQPPSGRFAKRTPHAQRPRERDGGRGWAALMAMIFASTSATSSSVSGVPSYASSRAAMLHRPAKVLATFPRTHCGERMTQGCANRKPCLGGGEPVLRWAKKAFSAPST